MLTLLISYADVIAVQYKLNDAGEGDARFHRNKTFLNLHFAMFRQATATRVTSFLMSLFFTSAKNETVEKLGLFCIGNVVLAFAVITYYYFRMC